MVFCGMSCLFSKEALTNKQWILFLLSMKIAGLDLCFEWFVFVVRASLFSSFTTCFERNSWADWFKVRFDMACGKVKTLLRDEF